MLALAVRVVQGSFAADLDPEGGALLQGPSLPTYLAGKLKESP